MGKDTHTQKELSFNLGGYVFAISRDCSNERTNAILVSNELMKNAEPGMNILMAEDSSGPEKSLKSKSKEW